ncbi:signal peptide containing protein [Theileria equi strain WA]|uniref:FAD synthase n=1 Tax=Theileria equi strain WA TaxID=1537102 RepID=L1L9R0_THEEQ|nr:signal peptide containing protein [Theileria equi strain WA]EKX72162.1 signal peptide containing protein [Theileria equi strain WA]|eukprot:XP_004831614.1 signal peptide containing protein [Theileria equi strain WA]
MRVLTVLLAVSLVRLCHCGGDNGGAKGGVKGAVAQQDPVKPVQPNTQGPPGQTQANLSTPTQQAVKPVTASSGKADVLDLANPDESKVDILKASRNKVEKKEYYPKDTSKITSVVDGQTPIWTASEEDKFLSAKVSSKRDSSLAISLKKAVNKYFQKAATDGILPHDIMQTSGYSNVYLSFNGGKDSIVALHLYRIARDMHRSEDIDFNSPLQGVYFNNFGSREFPEMASFVDFIKKRYEIELR